MKCGQMHASILEDFPARTLVPVKPQEWEGKDLAEEGRYAAWTPGSICSVTSKYPNHIWLVDLTTFPTSSGFWTPWLPYGPDNGREARAPEAR